MFRPPRADLATLTEYGVPACVKFCDFGSVSNHDLNFHQTIITSAGFKEIGSTRAYDTSERGRHTCVSTIDYKDTLNYEGRTDASEVANEPL